MKFHGVVLQESLTSIDCLSKLHVTKTEQWDVPHSDSKQPKVWHAMFYEGETSQAKSIAHELSQALKSGPWYTNFTVKDRVYIIVSKQVWTYPKGDREVRAKIEAKAVKHGIPQNQCDWKE